MYINDVYFEWKVWISQAGLFSERSSLYIVPQPPAQLVPPSPKMGEGFWFGVAADAGALVFAGQ